MTPNWRNGRDPKRTGRAPAQVATHAPIRTHSERVSALVKLLGKEARALLSVEKEGGGKGEREREGGRRERERGENACEREGEGSEQV